MLFGVLLVDLRFKLGGFGSFRVLFVVIGWWPYWLGWHGFGFSGLLLLVCIWVRRFDILLKL